MSNMTDLLSNTDHSGNVVAHLCFHHSAEPNKDEYVPVHGDDEFDIGRTNVPPSWNVNRMVISTHHLYFHCVTYEGDVDGPHITPMVYVRVLSSRIVGLQRSNFNSLSCENSICRNNGDILLNHMDVLHLTPTIRITLLGCVDEPLLNSVQRTEVGLIANQYLVTDRLLGKGGQASVVVAIKTSSRRQYACKIVSAPSSKPATSAAESREAMKQRADMTREYTILKSLNHPNIISLEKVFYSNRNTYILQELVTGGDLLSHIDSKVQLGSPQAAVIVRQVLKAVEYLHDHHIVHRDIKPENVLLSSWREGARVVLTDFGQARYLMESREASKVPSVFRMQSKVGTFGYIAPEVATLFADRAEGKNGYSKAIDIWSIGCLTAILLTGESLFGLSSSTSNVFNEVQAYPAQLATLDTGRQWKTVGNTPKSFIRGCLVLNEDQRLTAKQALEHLWFTNSQYVDKMHAAYQRAIRDWRPHARTRTLIEYLEAPTLPSPKPTSSIARLADTSHHFPVLPTPRPIFSPSLSRPFDPRKLRTHTPLPRINEDLVPPMPKSTLDQDTAFVNIPECILETPQRKQNPITFPPQALDLSQDQDSLSPPKSFNESLFRPVPV